MQTVEGKLEVKNEYEPHSDDCVKIEQSTRIMELKKPIRDAVPKANCASYSDCRTAQHGANIDSDADFCGQDLLQTQPAAHTCCARRH